MNRRHFLAASLAMVAPTFLAEAFAAEPTATDLDALTVAFHAARAAGRPLLVIVVPQDEAARYDRGHVWGELLMNADDDTMAWLGQAQVVVALDASVRLFAPQARRDGEPWLWLLRTDAVGAPARAVDVSLPAPVEAGAPWEDHEAWQRASDRTIDGRIAAAGGAVRRLLRGVVPDPVDLPRADRVALADLAKRTLREGVPANTYWATAGGCGTHVEGVEVSWGIGCGMGAVPERSRRFLYFFDIEKYRQGSLW